MDSTTEERNEKVYRLEDDGLTWFQRWWQQNRKGLPIQILIWGALTIVIYIGSNGWPATSADLFRILRNIAFVLIVLNLISLFSFKRTAPRLQSYQLNLSEDQISQIIDGSATITIERKNLNKIIDAGDYGLVIHGKDHAQRIVIWPTTVGYEEIKELLNTWQSIHPPEQFSIWRLPRGILPILIFLLFGVLVLSKSPVLIVPAGLILIGISVWFIIEMPKQSKILRSTRVLLMFFLMVVMAGVAWQVIVSLR